MAKIEKEPEIVPQATGPSVAQQMAAQQMAQQMSQAQQMGVDPVTGMAQVTGVSAPAPQQFDPLAGLGLGGGGEPAASGADDDDNSIMWAAAAAGAAVVGLGIFAWLKSRKR